MKNQKPLKVYIRPFSYIKTSIGSEMAIMLVLLLVQVALLLISKSFNAVIVIAFAVAGAVLSNLVKEKCVSVKIHKHYSYLISVVQGLLVGFFVPETFPPLTVFLITFLVMFTLEHFFGGFSYSLVNPSAFAVVTMWIIGISLFGKNGMTMATLSIKNPSEFLIQNGYFEILPFDADVTNFLNRTIFKPLNISIPVGYMSLLWDTHSIIPAFRYNLVTLLSSIVIFSSDGKKALVSIIFVAVYISLIRILSPVFYLHIAFQGDMILAILTSGTLFCATFVLNWYGSIPETVKGKALYGVLSGIVAFWTVGCGLSPIGMMFVVLVSNFVSIFIQYYEKNACYRKTKKVVESNV